jgi:glycosyltransferase involved in cell wall biosynthesis
VVAGEHLLVADDAEAFARSLLGLLDDPAMRERLAANGRRLVAERYSWEAVWPTFLGLVERVASREQAVAPVRDAAVGAA